MIPSVSQGWGGQLYLIKGAQVDIVNKSLEATANSSTTTTVGIVDNDIGDSTDFYRMFYGGQNSWFPDSYANHKPCAFSSRGRLIQALNHVEEAVKRLYIGGWDGSGLFYHKGGEFEARLWKSGRGWDALSPSGITHNVKTFDLALITHHDIVFGLGVHNQSDAVPAVSQWTNKLGWTFDFDNIGDLSVGSLRRCYRVFSIDADDKRIMGPVTRFQPDALNQSHLHSCDAITFKDDIYYANWIDVVRFPGASGIPQVMYSDVQNPRARSFNIWPSGGFDSNGNSIGEIRLLELDGDGLLYRLTVPASGRNLLVDLTTIRANENGRPQDNFLARVQSSTNEPGRTPLLLTFNNELHAFVVTESSGFMHFTCDSNPSGVSNWADRTTSLPPDLWQKDGNVYGFTDTVHNKIYLMHVAYSAFGVFGSEGGGQNSGGGYWLYQYDANRNWYEINRGVIGLPSRGLIPYQNLGPYAAVPSGNNPELHKCSDYAILTYKLYDPLARLVDVDIEYSTDAAVWKTARRFRTYDTGTYLGSGIQNLATSPQGIEYNFYWDYVNNVGFNESRFALLRVRPKLVR